MPTETKTHFRLQAVETTPQGGRAELVAKDDTVFELRVARNGFGQIIHVDGTLIVLDKDDESKEDEND